MKLKYLAIAACLGCATAAQAASLVVDNPDNHPYFGARLGVDISSMANGGPWYSSKAGFSLGAVYNIPLFMNLYFEPGLSIFYDTFGTLKYDAEANPLYQDGVPGQPEEKVVQVDGSIRNLGFRIPMNIGYHFDFAEDLSLKVFTGPQINFSFLAKYHQNRYRLPVSDEIMESQSHSIFGTNGFKHIDLQWNFGLGLDYQRYYVGLTGSLGITKMMESKALFPDNPHKKLRRDLFTITVGYNF